jgi:aspartokinase/homoserine dehydrogenase 1
VEVVVIVMKFGGTSVGSGPRMAEVARLACREPGPVVVVVSAMGGTTDQLLRAGALAESGQLDGAFAVVEALRERHLDALPEEGAAAGVGREVELLRDLLRGVSLLREQTPRSRALLMSFGERLSAPLVAGWIRRAGRESVAVDARDVLVTDATFEEAAVDETASRPRVEGAIGGPARGGVIPVVTGFLGATRDGLTTVLGRGGSDYTGALLGGLLGAREIWIWTDVDGILSADPRLVRDARTLRHVSFREAAEMSYFGAKVIHPKTMVPAMEAGIPIRVRSTFAPDAPGTLITADGDAAEQGVKTVTAVRDQALVTVEGRGLAGLPGTARRIFEATERAAVNVVMISQASSEQSVSLVVPARRAQELARTLDAAFALEIRAGLVEPARIVGDVAVVSAVGEGMAGRAGTSARLFSALSTVGVNVLAIAQGAAERSISAAVHADDAGRAVRAVHAAFGLRRTLDLVLVGHGKVGRALATMLSQTGPELARTHGVALRVLGVVTRSRAVLDPDGIDPHSVDARLATAPPRPDDASLLLAIDAARSGDAVLVDLTAADLTALHRGALEAAFHVVTANKVPISGPLVHYRGLVEAVRRTGARYGYETTFGAGLPVLHTLKELLATGDRLEAVTGCFSGTLGFLCSRLDDGADVATAVREAEAAGFTEPDPREDLSGRDVARKALIVARAMGLALEPEDVSTEPFLPGLGGPLDTALAHHGAALEARRDRAQAAGEVLRFVAEVRRGPDGGGRVAVGLREVARDSALGSLRGPDNLLVFTTRRYA